MNTTIQVGVPPLGIAVVLANAETIETLEAELENRRDLTPAEEVAADLEQKPLRAKFALYQGQPFVALFHGPLRLNGEELSANVLARLGEQFTSLARMAKTSASSKAITWVELS